MELIIKNECLRIKQRILEIRRKCGSKEQDYRIKMVKEYADPEKSLSPLDIHLSNFFKKTTLSQQKYLISIIYLTKIN